MPGKAGGRALEGELQRGSSGDPDSSKKLSWRQLEFPNEEEARRRGENIRPNGHEGHNGNTSADDKYPLSQCYIVGSNPTSHALGQAIADFRQPLWNLGALAGLDTSEALGKWKTKRALGRPQNYPSKQKESGCELKHLRTLQTPRN